jgi:hypothetical protein
MSETSGWATERCEKHDMVSCADCLNQNRMRRTATGEVRYQDDCGVDTFREITGADYDFAAEVLREAGFTPGAGTRATDLRKAFESVGFKVTEVTHLGIDHALEMSALYGRDFYVCGWTRSKNPEGHAWTIQKGRQNRDFLRHKRIVFKLYEVTA